MKIENNITTVQLEDRELKKILDEYQILNYDKIENFHKDYPNLHDLLNTLSLHYQNRSSKTDREINTF